MGDSRLYKVIPPPSTKAYIEKAFKKDEEWAKMGLGTLKVVNTIDVTLMKLILCGYPCTSCEFMIKTQSHLYIYFAFAVCCM